MSCFSLVLSFPWRFNQPFTIAWTENVSSSRIHAEELIGLCHLVTQSHKMAEPDLRDAV